MNPFYPVAAFPDFPAMTPAAAEEALPKLLADAKAAVDALERDAPPTWDGFVRALDDATRPLYRAWRVVTHFLSVLNGEAWRKLQTRFQPEIVAFSLRVGQSRRFYELAKKTPADTPVRRRILDKMIQEAELSGVALSGECQKRFNEIESELAKLSSDFRDHVLDATKAFSLMLTRPAEVEGLPAPLKAAMAGGVDPAKGPWKASIEEAVYYPFMKHSRNRPVREALMRARCTRASAGANDNTPIIDRILALRQERAKMLGFASYADLSLAEKCAPSTAAVHAMIDELAAAAKPVKAREDAALAAFAQTALEPWDRSFWSERQREKLYSYSEEELMQYFNLPEVLKGLFGLAERLFDVTVEERPGAAPVWHPDVRFFRVKEGGKTIAHFYLDPYSRPETKRGGAWAHSFSTREVRTDGTTVLPLALIVCNFSRPDAKGRALMRFSEVETLFHEFGHALQHMLTRVDDAGASGLGLIDWDAVEVASQFMENWCVDPKTVRAFARHVETGQPIPEKLLARVRAARNYRAANSMLGQLSLATVDMLLHEGGFAGTPNDVKNRVFNDLTPGTTVPGDRFLNSFSHIFAGGYGAGYYGYKWSEVMSADCFGAFEEAGLDDEEAVRRVGRRYRDTLLALGGGTDPMEVFRLFRGRAPQVKALLRQSGLLPSGS